MSFEPPNAKKSLIPKLSENQKQSSKSGKIGQHQLHILSKKSWHVWNKENLERVERDERMFEEQQLLDKQKNEAIEGERRFFKMKTSPSNDVKEAENSKQPNLLAGGDGHINLFNDQPLEVSKRKQDGKDSNFYLGHSALQGAPWYSESKAKLDRTAKLPSNIENSFYPKKLRERPRVISNREKYLASKDPLKKLKHLLVLKKENELRKTEGLVESDLSLQSSATQRLNVDAYRGQQIRGRLMSTVRTKDREGKDEMSQERKRQERRDERFREKQQRLRAIKRGEYDVKKSENDFSPKWPSIKDTEEKHRLVKGDRKSEKMQQMRRERIERENREREKALLLKSRNGLTMSKVLSKYNSGYMSFH